MGLESRLKGQGLIYFFCNLILGSVLSIIEVFNVDLFKDCLDNSFGLTFCMPVL